MSPDEKINAFTKELEALLRKHGAVMDWGQFKILGKVFTLS